MLNNVKGLNIPIYEIFRRKYRRNYVVVAHNLKMLLKEIVIDKTYSRTVLHCLCNLKCKRCEVFAYK